MADRVKQRIYLDNAATSFPKPDRVHKVMAHYARHVGASAGRGVYAEAVESGRIIDETRRNLCALLGVDTPENMIMTFNCTDGLVLAIKGIVNQPGGHVITSRMDHNSVLRPLHALSEQLDVEVTYIPADEAGMVDPDDLRKAIRRDTKLIVLVHGSNVCGSVQDIAAVGRLAREREVPFLVDAAQTVGHLPLNLKEMDADMVAFPGHKALLGPLGTGVLYIKPGMETRLQPLKEGGTGSKSEIPAQPDFLPDRFEAGSHNALGIAGLNEGVKYLLERGMTAIRQHEEQLCRRFLDATANIKRLKVYGPREIDKRVGVFSVTLEGYSPVDLAAALEKQFGLLTRPGLHCAPFAHQVIGSFDLGGTCRLSFGPFLTLENISYAADALRQLADGKK